MNTLTKLLCCIIFCSLALVANSQEEYVLEKLNNKINTVSYDEISPVISSDGSQIYFTRVGYPLFKKTLIENGEDLSQTLSANKFLSYLRSIFTGIANRYIHDPVESGFNQDIWIAEGNSAEFSKISHPNYPLNNALPNSVCALTPSENEVILLNQFIEDGGMHKGFSLSRRLPDGSWSFPQPVNINNYHNSGPDVSMTMSVDGNVIILAMERHDAYGKSDLYVSFREGENQWSEPKNLGHDINSQSRETTPFLSEDTKTLFFSSNRRGTKGGNDIFIMERLDESWRNWSRPRRFVEPINSDSDDSQPYFNSNTGYLYFTSKRDGSSDIFRVKIAPPSPVTVVVKGRILNAKTKKTMSGKVLSNIVGTTFQNVYYSEDGSYRMRVRKGNEYQLIAEAPGFTGVAESVKFKRSYSYHKEYVVDLLLNPMEVGSKIDLAPIYFIQSEPIVLKNSYKTLDQLASYMREHPNLYILIEGHTDNQGESESLQQLSEDRSAAIKHYLVYKKRVNPVRIETAGFGANYPLNDNSTEELRAANRRVEVKIAHISETVLGMSGKK